MFHIANRYNIFISHSWHYSNHYDKIYEWITISNITSSNYSISIEKKFPRMSKTQLKAAITEQISHASVVIIPAGMYASYSEWIDYEINEAIRMNKKILGIYPWGQERVPSKIALNADLMVHWQQDSVIRGIKQLL